MNAPDDLCATPESIAAAKDAMNREREDVFRTTGVWVDEQGQIHLPMKSKEEAAK